jgi:Spy/CpxP family protein refolding chaperone
MKMRGLLAAALLGAISAAACGGPSASAPPPATAGTPPDDAEAYALREHHRYHHGGTGLFLAMSLDTLGPSPGQRVAIENIQGELRSAREPARAAEHLLLATLADGVARSRFDAAAVTGAAAEVGRASANAQDASAQAMNELHGVLTPPQRAALADKVEANWAVWRTENAPEADAAPGAERGHLAALTAELDLTPQQQSQIRATLASEAPDAPRFDDAQASHFVAVAEAFRAPTFDARSIDAAGATGGELAGWGATHLARVIEAVSPVLTPDQRVRLARKLEDHANHPGGMEGAS